MSFDFFVHADITFGRGSLEKLPGIVGQMGLKKPMLIYDTGVEAAGIAGRVRVLLNQVCPDALIYDKVLPNPSVELVAQCAEIAQEKQADSFITVGGGSSIDLGKAVNVLMTNPPPIGQYAGIGHVKNALLPLIAIPTTAGTSSEITNVSALIDTEKVCKFVVIDNKLTPTRVLVDPELTATCPPAVTAGTGMDAITHALESYVANMATPLTGYNSLAAFKILYENLPRVMDQPDNMDAREQMMLGCVIAGFAFSNANLGLVHGIAHTLSAHFGMAHGLANAAVLPYVLEFNAPSVPEKMIELAKCIGLPLSGEGAQDSLLVAQAMKRMANQVGIKPLSSCGIGEKDIEPLTRDVLNEPVLGFNPRQNITHEDVAEIIRKAL